VKNFAVSSSTICLNVSVRSEVMHGNFLRAVFLTISLSLVAAPAQQDGGGPESGDLGTGGRHTVQGRLYLPSGRKLDRRLRVRLSSVRGGENSTQTDDNGSFTFRRLTGGTYTLTVEGGRDFESATETVDVLDSPRRDAPGQVFTVQIRLEAKRPARAEARPGVVSAAAAPVPKAAVELYEKAVASARGGEHKQAVEQLRAALELHAEFPLALNELGVQYMTLGEPAKAAEALRAAVRLAPDEPNLRINFGILLLRQKKYAEAEAELGRAAALDEANAFARLHRGHALIRLGRGAEAERELQLAVRLGGERPETALAYRYLGALYNDRGDDARAAAALEAYLRLAPDAPDAEQVRAILADLKKK
jgi:Flp pilus assembly protein TadD